MTTKPLRKLPNWARRLLLGLSGLLSGLDISMPDDNATPLPIEDSMVSSLDALTTRGNGQTVWGCTKFYGADYIADDLYLKPFSDRPLYSAPSLWDDGDILPNTIQVANRNSCG